MLDGIQLDHIAFIIPIGEGFPVYWYGILITLGLLIRDNKTSKGGERIAKPKRTRPSNAVNES